MEDAFCDFPLKKVAIQGLRARIIKENEIIKLTLYDREGPKWEIRRIEENRISLYHRSNKNGDFQPPMHYQGKSSTATVGGVKWLLDYIDEHEVYERRIKKSGFLPRRRRKNK